MKKINNYWTDDNNNTWNCNSYTEETAKELSETLIDCHGCSNCSNCSDCSYCRNCRNCSNCSYCSYCRNCSYCSDCRDCRGCSDFKQNPQRYVTKNIGSRASQTYFYWTHKRNQIICGCNLGTLKEFKKRVKTVYKKTNKYYKEYAKEIKIMEYLYEKA